MKRILFAMCALFVCLATFAGDNIKIKSGKAAFMQQAVKVCVAFDWSNATWDNRQSLKEQLGADYDKYLKDGEASFIEGFQKGAKTVTYTANAGEAQYKITVSVQALDYFFGMGTFAPGHKHKLTATITATDASGNVVYTAYADTFTGGRDSVKYDSYKKCMKAAGEKVASFK